MIQRLSGKGDAIKHQDACCTERLREHLIGLVPLHPQATADEPNAREEAEGDAHRRGDEVVLEGILHREDDAQEERQTSSPGEQLDADKLLHVELGPWWLWLADGFGSFERGGVDGRFARWLAHDFGSRKRRWRVNWLQSCERRLSTWCNGGIGVLFDLGLLCYDWWRRTDFGLGRCDCGGLRLTRRGVIEALSLELTHLLFEQGDALHMVRGELVEAGVEILSLSSCAAGFRNGDDGHDDDQADNDEKDEDDFGHGRSRWL